MENAGKDQNEFVLNQGRIYSFLQSKIAIMDIPGETYELGAFIEKALGICVNETSNNTNTFSTKRKIEFMCHFKYFKEFEKELRDLNMRDLFCLIPSGNIEIKGKSFDHVLVQTTPNAIKDLAVLSLKKHDKESCR